MKKFNTFIKILSALAAAVGAVYIVATYGDRIVAWAKQLMGCHPTASFHFTASTEPEAEPAPAEPEVGEAAPVQEPENVPAAEAPETPVEEESTPVASEEDFEG